MSYQYKSYSQTTTTSSRNFGGQSHTTSATRTTTSSSENGTQTSVVIREISENEFSGLSIESTQNYEIADDDRLTKYDFLSLMDSEDEDVETETESESDVEYHWFPSLLRNSVIQFLDDQEQEDYMLDDDMEANSQVQIEENNDNELIESEEDDDDEAEMEEEGNGKRQYRRRHRSHNRSEHVKRPKKSEQVPIEVVRIYL